MRFMYINTSIGLFFEFLNSSEQLKTILNETGFVIILILDNVHQELFKNGITQEFRSHPHSTNRSRLEVDFPYHLELYSI